MIIPPKSVADAASVAAHYDDLDPFYRAVWGSHVHHGYWVTGNESTDEAVLNLTRLVAIHAGIRNELEFAISAAATERGTSLQSAIRRKGDGNHHLQETI